MIRLLFLDTIQVECESPSELLAIRPWLDCLAEFVYSLDSEVTDDATRTAGVDPRHDLRGLDGLARVSGSSSGDDGVGGNAHPSRAPRPESLHGPDDARDHAGSSPPGVDTHDSTSLGSPERDGPGWSAWQDFESWNGRGDVAKFSRRGRTQGSLVHVAGRFAELCNYCGGIRSWLAEQDCPPRLNMLACPTCLMRTQVATFDASEFPAELHAARHRELGDSVPGCKCVDVVPVENGTNEVRP